jgi:hypothetical protein
MGLPTNAAGAPKMVVMDQNQFAQYFGGGLGPTGKG